MKGSTLAGLFGMIILIVMFIFGGLFVANIVSGVDETAVIGTELEQAAEVIQPIEQGLTNLLPVFVWIGVIGLLAIGLFTLWRSRK